jgi:nondiscriminating glutamyl-tRNA synthetase
MSNTDFRVRAAPSPTGRVHTGNLRTFLNNFLFVKNVGGKYILRIEDTDQKRKVDGGIEAIVETLGLYGIEFDESPLKGGKYSPYIQSERLDIYKKYALELVEKGFAYYCFCTEERLQGLKEESEKAGYDGFCKSLKKEEIEKNLSEKKPFVVRLKFPEEGITEFKDEIYGRIKIKNNEIDDQVILKSDGYPTYHFAVVIDDHLMDITHAFRGREYLSQTPKNVFLYNSLGWEQPKWVHTPHLLNPDGVGKLSKRKGAVSAISYLRKGYLPEAVLNYLALCGWAPKGAVAKQDEIYSVDELIELFSIDRMKKSNARYDQRKLNYINSKHIRNLGLEKLLEYVFHWAENLVLKNFIADEFDEIEQWEKELKEDVKKYLPLWKEDKEYFKKALELEFERLTFLAELPKALNFFYEKNLTWTDEDWNTKNHTKGEIADVLENILPSLEKLFENKDHVSHEQWEKLVRGYADGVGWKHGDVFLAIRSATTGRLKSPPLLESFEIMGREKVKAFVLQAIDWLRE